ncbi:MAG: hypothetical protein GF308_17325 [Candidatus Heimdallarchaeota archaeon]|nr:hypothetical protein [Candidatus Heimdallarchaeota archaeon]
MDLKTMVSDEEKEIEKIKQEIQTKAKKRRKKSRKKQEKDEEIDHNIHMNRWGILFFFLFFGIIGYLIISYQTGLPPFDLDMITGEISLVSDLLFTVLLIIGFVLLGSGIYFGWIKEQPTTDDQAKDEIEGLTTEKLDNEKGPEGVIVFTQNKENEEND